MAKLEELRSALGEIDRQMLGLIARRRNLAIEIGREKRKIGHPTRDYARERDVLLRVRALAAELGVPAHLAEEIMRAQIRSSLTVQERDKVSAGAGGEGRKVLVIGGTGKMGAWFARFLAVQGYQVEIADPKGGDRKHFRDGPLEHDLIVVAVPLGATAGVLCEIAEARPLGVVFDVGSLKTPLRTGFEALTRAGVQVTSIHPMFGPDTELLSGRHVIFVDLGDAGATQAVRALFSPTMATLVDMDLEVHDKAIAYVLGLSHALNIAFFTALAESGETAPTLQGLSSTTFDAQVAVSERVSRENPHLYFEIQALNDYGLDALTGLLASTQRLVDLIEQGDEPGFVALMERGRSYLNARQSS